MTISATNSRKDYVGNGVLDTYPFDFIVFASSDLKVYIDGSLKTMGVHYTVTGAFPGIGNVVFTAGNIPAASTAIIIEGDTPLTQTTDLDSGEKFYEDSLEKMSDKVTILLQQIKNRSMLLPLGHPVAGPIPFPSLIASKFLRTNPAGTGLEFVSSSLSDIVGVLDDVVPISTDALFPAPGTAGRLRGKSDGEKGLWLDDGASWVSVLGEILSALGAGPHSLGGVDSEGNSILNIGGTFSGGLVWPTDVRAININSTLNMRALYSSEGINVRPAFVVPATGEVASAEGVHIDLSNADWDNGGTVANVYAFRVRGLPLHSAVQTATGIFIENGFGTNASVARYNILSAGIDSRNRFDGRMEVYGPKAHLIGNGYNPVGFVGLIVDPTSDNTGVGAGTDFSAVMRIGWNGSANPAPTQDGFGLIVSPRIALAASGVHSDFAGAEFRAPLIVAGGATVTNAATLKILNAPTAGSSKNYILWIRPGLVRWDDPIPLGGGAAPTLGTIGGSGPTGAAQARWLRVEIDGTPSFIPVWQ